MEICTVLANFWFPNIGGAPFETGSVLAEYMECNCVEMKGITHPYNEQCTPKNKFAHSEGGLYRGPLSLTCPHPLYLDV